tara:strand:+ start:831 stop:1130 length:300 start_codon:yes stop_codon:yes gene_type:complete
MTDKICSECKEERFPYDYSHKQKMCDFCYESDYHQGTRNVKTGNMMVLDQERMEKSMLALAEEIGKVAGSDYWRIRRMIHCLQQLNEDMKELILEHEEE